jgi:hypothetical protein
MKPGKNDRKAALKFTMEELDFLQDNTWQMAESFGLDRRIDHLTGKRAIGLYAWDLELLGDVTKMELEKTADSDLQNLILGLLEKINDAERSIR